MSAKIELAGRTFGRLLVIGFVEYRNHQSYWECVCSCGNSKAISKGSLLKGVSNSCGCLNSEITANRNFKHGLYGTAEYNSWSGMLARCYNPNNPHYEYYGARGISVCPQWRDSFQNFMRDIGPKPSPKLSIDRVDNDGNYSPENCRWATAKQQRANRRAPRPFTKRRRITA
jgi:hypothetical protein